MQSWWLYCFCSATIPRFWREREDHGRQTIIMSDKPLAKVGTNLDLRTRITSSLDRQRKIKFFIDNKLSLWLLLLFFSFMAIMHSVQSGRFHIRVYISGHHSAIVL